VLKVAMTFELEVWKVRMMTKLYAYLSDFEDELTDNGCEKNDKLIEAIDDFFDGINADREMWRRSKGE
jgi:hypothetical protein